MLTPAQRALLVLHCHDHVVAICPECSEALTFDRIGTDVIMGKRDFCPVCRADLTATVLKHIADCTVMRVQEGEAEKRRHEMAS
jgi:hypothetical protein